MDFLKNKFFLIPVALFLFALFLNFRPKKIENTAAEKKIKNVEILNFGEWRPENFTEILGTTARQNETEIAAKVAGTIEKILVSIGDEVQKNQILATLQKIDDATQINFENAARNLSTTKNSAQNSVRAAEIELENAEISAVQTKKFEAQKYQKNFDELLVRAKNSETLVLSAVDWADKILLASDRFRGKVDMSRTQIGAMSSIKKGKTKNLLEEILHDKKIFAENFLTQNAADVLNFADERLKILKKTKIVHANLNDLIIGTNESTFFPAETKYIFQTESDQFLGKINQQIFELESAIEGAKNQHESKNSAILAAENKLENARAKLNLQIANSKNQISAAENKFLLARKSQKDLEIRAPFSGKIFDKKISVGNQIAAGQKIFAISDENSKIKIVAFLSADEFLRAKNLEKIKIKIGDEIFEIAEIFLSEKLNETKKARLELLADEIPNLIDGDFVKILLPIAADEKNLLPLSAISFEPDGAEILFLNSEKIATRRKIAIGKIVGDCVEILEEIPRGTEIIKFKNQVFSGEKVEILQK